MNTPKSRDNGVVVQELGKEVLIYDLDNHRGYSLNETSAIIWKLCDGKTSVEQMSRLLAGQLNNHVSKEVVWLALDSFKKNNLLVNSESIEIEFNGLTRRQVIRKVGLASMIALPIISSIVAPTAAQSASVLALNATCTSSGQCASGNCQTGTAQPGPRCCVPGVVNNGAPGQPIGCDTGCTRVRDCCSGSARVGPDLAQCTALGFPPGSSCYCN